MKRIPKLWTGLGVAAIAGSMAAQADVIVVNTCSFIDTAKQESVDTILQMARYKQSGENPAGRAQKFISHPGTATGLMNRRRRFRMLHDAGDRVRHVQYKTRRQLSIGTTSVHQARRIRHKLASQPK